MRSWRVLSGSVRRTLRRKLSARGVRYRDVLDELRSDLGRQLLDQGRESIDVADRVGFSSRGGFERAFRRYTGQAPSEYRARKAR